jgi:peptidyl-tRNA hydrolase
VAGPWFTVQASGADWQKLEHIWISNGQQDIEGHVEIKVELVASEEAASNVGQPLAGVRPQAKHQFQPVIPVR